MDVHAMKRPLRFVLRPDLNPGAKSKQEQPVCCGTSQFTPMIRIRPAETAPFSPVSHPFVADHRKKRILIAERIHFRAIESLFYHRLPRIHRLLADRSEIFGRFSSADSLSLPHPTLPIVAIWQFEER